MSELDRKKPVADPAITTSSTGVSRRVMLRGVGAVTLGVATVGVLAACGGGDDSSSSGGGTTAGSGSAAADGALAKVSDIPVGGAISATGSDGKPIILSQPTAGTVVGLSAICTHQGCTVAPDGAELKCPCHGSIYKASDGSNVSGPAPSPLPKVTVHVENGEVLAG